MQVKATSPLTHNISGTAKVTNLINILYPQVLCILYDTYTFLYIGSCTEPDGILYMGQQGHIQGGSGHPPGQFYVYTRLVICIVCILFVCVCLTSSLYKRSNHVMSTVPYLYRWSSGPGCTPGCRCCLRSPSRSCPPQPTPKQLPKKRIITGTYIDMLLCNMSTSTIVVFEY